MSHATPAGQVFLETLGRMHTFLNAVTLTLESATSPKSPESSSHAKTELEVEHAIEMTDYAAEWWPVMLVTATEAYLQDVLAYAASIDPGLMKHSTQAASYADIIRVDSIADLAEEIRMRWARNFVDSGGPSKWIERLQRMGARGYPPELALEMERIWGIRHVVVHRAGRLTRDFIARHGTEYGGVEQRIQIDYRTWVTSGTVQNFFAATDKYFLDRFPAGHNGHDALTTLA